MPVLPCGLEVALLIDHIMEPDRNWFRAPDGRFWYLVPDLTANPPPFSPGDEWLQEYVTAPVPRMIDGVKQFVRVCIGLENGMMYWRGKTLVDFPKYQELSDVDLRVWREWLATDAVTRFLEAAIVKCATQAEINKDATGFAVLRMPSSNEKSQRDSGYIQAEKVIDNPLKGNN